MSDNMSDIFNNVKQMVDSGNIPSDLKNMISSIQNSNQTQNEKSSQPSNSNTDLNNLLNNLSPETIASVKQLASQMQNSNTSSDNKSTNNSSSNDNQSSTNGSTSNPFGNIDMNTLLKMKNIMESMNQKDDARANLLHSLKPYLRDSKKDQVDQYVNLLNITKVAEIIKDEKKGKGTNG